MEEGTAFRAEPGEASYATLAHVINAVHPGAGVVRQDVYNWHMRKTRNAKGAEFPAPIREIVEGDRRQGQPSVFFDSAAVLAWYRDGLAE